MINTDTKRKLVILTGPTGVGKTALSILLAQKINAEIISADSMQVYKYMDIGSAKIQPFEMMEIPHHLIDILNPLDNFDVVTFQRLAKEAMESIYNKGKIPLIVGGTGFYIQSVLYDIDFTEEKTGVYREELENIAKIKGADYLYDMLLKVDPESTKVIHKNNIRKVIRALEYYHDTGEKISAHNEQERLRESRYDFNYFVLNMPRERLFENIDIRVDKMVEEGLLEEVLRLQEMGCKRGISSMQGLGYKEILDYLDGEYDFSEAVRIIKRDTRHFAKRQLTWFKRERDVTWLNKEEFDYDNDRILEYMIGEINK